MTQIDMIYEEERLAYGKEVEERVRREVTEEVTEKVTEEVTEKVTKQMVDKAIVSLVMVYRQTNGTMADVVKNITVNYELPEAEVKEKVARYWDLFEN